MAISLDVLSTREGVLMYPNQAAEEIENGGTFIAEVTYETLSTRAGVLRFPQEAANRILQIAASSSSSSSSPLLTDLIAYYRFNGNGNDSSGNARNSTVESGIIVSGKVNGALLEGFAEGSVSVPTTGEVTISMWINLGVDLEDTIAAGQIQLTDGTAFIYITQRSRNGNSTSTFMAASSDGIDIQEDVYSTPGIVASDTQWLHVAATFYTNGTMRIWTNGVDYEANYNLVPFEISSIQINSLPDAGSKIGDVGVWNRALSEAEILQLYNDGNGYDPTA